MRGAPFRNGGGNGEFLSTKPPRILPPGRTSAAEPAFGLFIASGPTLIAQDLQLMGASGEVRLG